MLEARARLLFDGEVLRVDVGGAAQRERDHPGADGLVGVAVDDDEGAGLAVALIGIERDRHRRREVQDRSPGRRSARRAAEMVDCFVLDRHTIAGTHLRRSAWR